MTRGLRLRQGLTFAFVWAAGTGCAALPCCGHGSDAEPLISHKHDLPAFPWIDNCATITPGAIPAPNGSYLTEWQHRHAVAATADDFVIYLHEWYRGGLTLGPYGMYHLNDITKRLPGVPFPVVVQPCWDAGQNEQRRLLIVQQLLNHGISDAEQRVLVVFPKAEGLYGADAPRVYRQLLGEQRGSSGTSGLSGFGGFSGGFRGAFGGGLSPY